MRCQVFGINIIECLNDGVAQLLFHPAALERSVLDGVDLSIALLWIIIAVSTTTKFAGAFINNPFGSWGILPSGIVTTTKSRPRGASDTGTGLAPVSFARSARVAGPRELATTTSCPRRVKCRVRAPPIFPAPMIPIFNFFFMFPSTATEPTNVAERQNLVYSMPNLNPEVRP